MNLWAKPVGWMTPNAKAANKTMSGLDGLGWPNPKDEPKPKKTMNSQLEIKLATKMTDTPETDQAECESIAAYIESYGPDAVFPCDGYDHARKLERERDEAQETIATMEIRHAAVMLHTQSIVDDANQCREQRDRLAAALRKLADCDWVITPHDRMDAVREIARKALQSLTPNEKQ